MLAETLQKHWILVSKSKFARNARRRWLCILLTLKPELVVEIFLARDTDFRLNLRIPLPEQPENIPRCALPRLVIIQAEDDTVKRRTLKHPFQCRRQLFR